MKIIERIHDVTTNEIIDSERELSATELAAYEKQQAEMLLAKQIAEQKEIAKKAVLEKLGLTEQEAEILLS